MIPISDTDSSYICDLQAPCFQQLPQEAIQLIKKSKTQVMFRKGDNLCKQGTFSSYILFVVSGLAVQYVEGEGQKNFNLRLIQPVEFIGLNSVFSSRVYDYSALALSDCHVILVEKEALQEVLSENSVFAMQLMRRYSEQNSELYETIAKLQFKQMNGRFADALLYVDSLKKDFPKIFTYLTRKQLAEFAGISTESSVKLLKSLEKEGLISLKQKDIVIENYSALKQLSQLG